MRETIKILFLLFVVCFVLHLLNNKIGSIPPPGKFLDPFNGYITSSSNQKKIQNNISGLKESVDVVKELNKQALKVQIDAEALARNYEISEETFRIAKPYLIHVHANEPNFEILGTSGLVDHKAIGGHLRTIKYQGFVSIEQKMLNDSDPIVDMAKSIRYLIENYT